MKTVVKAATFRGDYVLGFVEDGRVIANVVMSPLEFTDFIRACREMIDDSSPPIPRPDYPASAASSGED